MNLNSIKDPFGKERRTSLFESLDKNIESRISALAVVPVWLIGTWALISFLLVHDYTGIRHDGILYMGQALLRLHPEIFRVDPFFANGSQDEFTLFSPLYATLIQIFGIGAAAKLLVFVGLLLSFFVSGILLRTFLAPRWAALGLCFVAMMQARYGGNGIFSIQEAFLTARSFAEPIGLLSVYFFLTRRPVLCGATFVLAASFHPIISLGPALLIWALACAQQPRFYWTACLAILLPVAAALDIPLFNKFSIPFDETWKTVVQTASPHLFPSRWDLSSWGGFAFDTTVLYAAYRLCDGHAKSLASACIVSLCVSVTTAILVEWSQNPFLLSLQLWRAAWIVKLCVLGFIPFILMLLWKRDRWGRVSASLLTLSYVLVGAHYWLALPIVAGALLTLLAKDDEKLTVRACNWTLMAVLLSIVISTARQILASSAIVSAYELDRSLTFISILNRPFVLFGALLTVAIFFKYERWRPALIGLSIASLALTVLHWDRRAPWTQYVESSLVDQNPFSEIIEPTAQVFWLHELDSVWLILKRPSFYTPQQLAGAIFNQKTAADAKQRQEAVGTLELQETLCRLHSSLEESAGRKLMCELSIEGVAEACKVDNRLRYIVLYTKIEKRNPVAIWSPPVSPAKNPYGSRTLYLYQCSQLV